MTDKILLIDKPKDWTSFDVIAKLRNALKQKTGQKLKVGHAGTLDPFATGLLVVLIGKATKKQDEFMKKDKEYEATLHLGATSTTGDPEGEIAEFSISNLQSPRHPDGRKDPGLDSSIPQNDNAAVDYCVVPPSNDEVLNVLNTFRGSIDQTPHAFSAIKVEGKRAYELAREGKEVALKSRKVYIYEIELLEYNFPTLKIRVICSSGTYIRVLAEDIGKALGCGAYLTELRRTKIDKFEIEDALTIDQAIEQITLEN